MPNSMRRLTPEERPDEYEVSRNPNQPENDNNGAVAGVPGAVRPRDDNALSFRHFLQPHSDVVPQPPPTRNRNSRGSHSHPGCVDLVDVSMALPDFVQDHLVLESLASGEQLHDLSPSRQHPGHPLDLNVLNDILPDFGSSQRNPRRNSQGSTRRCGHESQGSSDDNPVNHGSALPDFLSDGPMQLNNADSSTVNTIQSPSITPNRSRCRPQLDNVLADEPVRGPSFESKESLRLDIERLRSELAEKNRRLNQMEVEVSRQRTNSSALESTLRTTERSLVEATKRAVDAEKQLLKVMREGSLQNGHGDAVSRHSDFTQNNGVNDSSNSVDARTVFNIAQSSENLISQLVSQMEELKRLTSHIHVQHEGTENPKEQRKPKH